MDTTQIVTKQQGQIICRVSVVCLPSAAYAMYCSVPHMALVPLSVYGSTQIYWRNPQKGWRRNLDIVVVTTCCLYQVYEATKASTGFYYFLCVKGVFITFLAGWILHNHGFPWCGMYAHALLHILATIGNFILYRGLMLESEK